MLKTVTRDDFTCTSEEVDNLKEKVTFKAKQIKQLNIKGERCQGGCGGGRDHSDRGDRGRDGEV